MLQGVASRFAAVVAGAATLAPGSALAANTGATSGFYEAKVLEPAAAYVARKPVRVQCALTAGAWRSYIVATYGEPRDGNGSAVIGGTEIHLSQDVCPSLRDALRGELQYTPTIAATIETLTHESIHTRGIRDEGVTDCAAMHEMPGVAVRFFHVRSGKQLRALMASAWTYHREAPPQYLTVC